MSPVFRHGGLRLYLLKLLDEAPRHGYDVIRLLQDRFLGVYSPSPGTIYPRLARLEEEGLVTHEVQDGKKIYKITDAGREELNRRLDDLADLEDELAASVRDIAREISRDVRETVRNMRDELTWAVREAAGNRAGAAEKTSPESAGTEKASTGKTSTGKTSTEKASTGKTSAEKTSAGKASADKIGAEKTGAEKTGAGETAAEKVRITKDDAPGSDGGQDGAADNGAAKDGQSDASDRSGAGEGSGDQSRGRPPRDWREWAEWAERHDWREWAEWARQFDWSDRASRQEWKDRAKASQHEWKDQAKAAKQGWKEQPKTDRQESKDRTWASATEFTESARDRHGSDRDLVFDLERLVRAFAKEIRGSAWRAEAVSDDAVGNLGRILTDALHRIRTEVFRSPDDDPEA